MRMDSCAGSGVNPAQPVNSSDREYFKQHRASEVCKLVVAPAVLGRISQKWVMPFTRCYRHPDGRFAGVVMVSAKVEAFSDLLAKVNVGEHGTAVFRKADGALIARYPPVQGPAGVPGHNVVSAEFRAAMATGERIARFDTAASPDGVERNYVLRRFNALPFLLLLAWPAMISFIRGGSGTGRSFARGFPVVHDARGSDGHPQYLEQALGGRGGLAP